MAIHLVDPLTDPRWDEFLFHHRHASVFHTRGWLSALQETYGHRPVAFATSAPGAPLENALVFCDVKSWITGQRLVSLPFSDHCDPLTDSRTDRAEILAHAQEFVHRNHYRYAEVRLLSAEAPADRAATGLEPAEEFYLHTLSLDPPSEVLFRNLHKDCIRRKVRRAEREQLTYASGHSEGLLGAFYRLQLRTRRNHGLPPQPLQWFRSLIEAMGDHLTIRLALKGDHAVAALLTLSFKNTITYKYGCSDERLNNLGGTPFLFWKTIQEAKAQGMNCLDLGRSEPENEGLLTFKDRLGAGRIQLKYYRLVPSKAPGALRRMATAAKKMIPNPRAAQLLKGIARHTPDAVLAAAGRILYRHVG